MQIFHLADTHIRLFKRHKEYEVVFERLYDYIRSNKQSDDIIFLGGDIVHNKTDMSPELIYQTSKFLKSCADICPTILICGNHDFSENSRRLDALTPIVDTLNHPNLHYWKDSGVYELHGIVFSVFGICDDKSNWVRAKDIKGKCKIALHHGPIKGATTDIGHEIESGITSDWFDGFSISMLGDIHKRQYLNDSKTVAYVGSTVQQNYSESVEGHGLIVWDVESSSGKFVEIPNDYAFVTFDLIDGICTIPDNLPKNLRVRIRHENSSAQQIEVFAREIGKKYTIVELIKQRSSNSQIQQRQRTETLGDSRNVDFQNKHIREYLNAIEIVDPEDMSAIMKLNAETNKLLSISNLQQNVVWKPVQLDFSNMLSYGSDNSICFDKLSDIVGLFSKNAEGKSAIFDILCFALYDKTPRASKAIHILNNSKDEFYCKVQFAVNEVDYFIERIGTRKKDGAVKVDVNFWTFDETGNKINLNGEDRDKTNFQIRNYVGTYDDFVLTALSTQYDNQNFIEKSQRDRKDLLYRFLDITIYDELFKLAKEESKECQTLIREYEREELHEKSSLYSTQIEDVERDLGRIESRLNDVNQKSKELTSQLLELNKIYVPISNADKIDTIENEIGKTIIEIETCENKIAAQQTKIEQIRVEIAKCSPIEIDNLDEISHEYSDLSAKINENQNELNLLERKLADCQKHKELLDNHRYDPNCKYCVDNDFVKSARIAIDNIPSVELSILERESAIESLKFARTFVSKRMADAKDIRENNTRLSNLTNDLNFSIEQQNSIRYKRQSFELNLQNCKTRKEEYLKNASTIERNKEILAEITTIEKTLGVVELDIKKLTQLQKNAHITLEGLKAKYNECCEKLDRYLEYVKRFKIYELYLKALSREGVPYRILETVLPVIEDEVNQILGSLVNFTVRMEASDDKYVHAYIVYDAHNSWPVELSSGMERFILSLAFRSSLSEITSLPKANFLVIDEGFGVLDSENLLLIGNLFSFLKKQYDFLICVSHIDNMKDLVDRQITIEKANGYSRISM